MSSQSKKLYALLRMIREKRQISQYEIAERIGVAQSSVSKFEGNHARQLDALVEYAAAMGVGLSVVVRVGKMEIRHDLNAQG